MRRALLLLVTLLLVGSLTAPAAAHHLEVSPKGRDGVITGWVGGGALPEQARGQGLIPGGPTGSYLQSPAHDGGLNVACERNEDNPSVVDIRGPAAPYIEDPECPHGI